MFEKNVKVIKEPNTFPENWKKIIEVEKNQKIRKSDKDIDIKSNMYLNKKLMTFSEDLKIDGITKYENDNFIFKSFFNENQGGRLGLIHGGCIYSLCLLSVNLFLDYISEKIGYKYKISNSEIKYKKTLKIFQIITSKSYLIKDNENEGKILSSENQAIIDIDKIKNIQTFTVRVDLFDEEGNLCDLTVFKIEKIENVKF